MHIVSICAIFLQQGILFLNRNKNFGKGTYILKIIARAKVDARAVLLQKSTGFCRDSCYEARFFVRGKVKSLGADCEEKEMRPEHLEILRDLLERAGADAKPEEFKRYGSARKLYNFNIDNVDAY